MKIERVKFEEFPGGIVKASVSGCRYDAMDKINGSMVAMIKPIINRVFSFIYTHPCFQ